jgi:exopolyphosphatase / guanosine-5'-triphosphate,3'-diphosphate pyrophosphatase
MTPMRCSVLDLGSNSFHVLVADLDGHRLTPVLREREMLHLGREVARHGTIRDETRREAVDTVAHLAELARRSGAVESQAVATAALRDADNGQEVIADLSDAAGVEVQVLDGLDEARLSYLGVRASIAVRDEPVLVLDLGGGSLEFAVGVGDAVAWSASVPIGASRLSAQVDNDPMKGREHRAIESAVDAAIDPLVDQVRAHAPVTTVTVGGTVRALARIAAIDEAVWLPATLNQLRVRRKELERLRDLLLPLDIEGRIEVPGMKERRADHLHVAAIVLARTLDRLDVTTTVVSDWGLREGLLFDSHGALPAPTADELRASEVGRIRETFVPDDPHPLHVARLAGQLFEGTRELHGLDGRDGDLLRYAAELHAVGEAVALRRQHQHGAYLVEHAELRGFDPDEAAMLTSLVRFHRSRGIDKHYPPFATLPSPERERFRRLLALLQVADGLDRARDQAVTWVKVVHDDGHVELMLAGGGLHATDAELERKTRMFCRTFDVELSITDLG